MSNYRGRGVMFIDKAHSKERKEIYIRLIQPRCPREGWQGHSLLAAYLGRVISPLITHCCSALLSIIIIIIIAIVTIIIIIIIISAMFSQRCFHTRCFCGCLAVSLEPLFPLNSRTANVCVPWSQAGNCDKSDEERVKLKTGTSCTSLSSSSSPSRQALLVYLPLPHRGSFASHA